MISLRACRRVVHAFCFLRAQPRVHACEALWGTANSIGGPHESTWTGGGCSMLKKVEYLHVYTFEVWCYRMRNLPLCFPPSTFFFKVFFVKCSASNKWWVFCWSPLRDWRGRPPWERVHTVLFVCLLFLFLLRTSGARIDGCRVYEPSMLLSLLLLFCSCPLDKAVHAGRHAGSVDGACC